jgi:5-methylcytosine-specific restriction endonuclease McrA
MPIKPKNKGRYPSNWSEIRAAILERAGHRCENCGAANRTRICRGGESDAGTYMTDEAHVYCADTGKYLGQCRMDSYSPAKMVDIVLTIAHLDHVPEHSEPENLRAWCQRCHLRYDAQHHAQSARLTRRATQASGDLFEVL